MDSCAVFGKRETRSLQYLILMSALSSLLSFEWLTPKLCWDSVKQRDRRCQAGLLVNCHDADFPTDRQQLAVCCCDNGGTESLQPY